MSELKDAQLTIDRTGTRGVLRMPGANKIFTVRVEDFYIDGEEISIDVTDRSGKIHTKRLPGQRSTIKIELSVDSMKVLKKDVR